MNAKEYEEYLKDCYVYIITKLYSTSNGLSTNVEFIGRDENVADTVLNKLIEKSTINESYKLHRATM